MTKSRVLKKLKAGEVVRTAGITRVTSPWLTELVGKLGYDLIWLDMEHREFGYDVIPLISLACRATGMDLMVRILKTGYSSIMRSLEFGANGIIVPHCRTAQEARQWADWCRFPPLGTRGFDGAGVDADYMLAHPLDHIKHANEETFLVLQIEDQDAVECVEEIAAVDGVDVLFVGPSDLSLSYGVPMQFDHPLVQNAMDRVAAACEKFGKAWGTITPTAEIAQNMVNRGARMITCGNDHNYLVRGFQASSEEFSRVQVLSKEAVL